MAKLIRGQRKGVLIHTPSGFYKNGEEPTEAQAGFLKEAGYKFEGRAATEASTGTAPAS